MPTQKRKPVRLPEATVRRASMPDLMLVGVTGGIGGGKSTVCRMFEEVGRTVIYADRIARELTESHPAIRAAIQKEFGDSLYDSSGKLDRPRLASIVFRDRNALLKLNSIVHPSVFAEIEQHLSKLQLKQTGPFVLIEAALIFETLMDERLDYTIVVSSDEEVALARIMRRDGSRRQDVLDRIKSQLPLKEKRALADFVIENDGSLEELRERVRFLDRLLSNLGPSRPI